MDINDPFDGIMKSCNQFAFDPAEQRLQEKTCLRRGFGRQVQETGRGPANGVRMRRISRRKRSGMRDLRPAGAVASLRDSHGGLALRLRAGLASRSPEKGVIWAVAPTP
jgi:hypothetical protein